MPVVCWQSLPPCAASPVRPSTWYRPRPSADAAWDDAPAGGLGAYLAELGLCRCPSETMASVVYLQVLYSGRVASSLVVGFSGRTSTYWLRGNVALPSLLLSIGRADLHELGFRGDGLSYVGIHLSLIAARRSASVQFFRGQRTGVCYALSAWGSPRNFRLLGQDCPSRLSNGASLRMSKMFDSIQNCRLRTGSRMRFRLLASRAPILFEASGKRLFLLIGLELRQ